MLSRTAWLVVLVAGIILLSALTELGVLTATVVIGSVAFVVFVPLRSVPHETRRLARSTGTSRAMWLAGAAVFVAGVGLVHLLGDPVYHVECATRTYRRCRTGHAWATIVFFLGTMGGVIAAGTYPAYRLVREGTRTTAGEVRPGPVIVTGDVVPCEDTLEAPFTGTDTVCHRYAVQERHNARLFADGGSWHTVAVGEATVPFYVADETGRVLVDPDGAYLTLNEVTTFGPMGDVSRAAVADETDSVPAERESSTDDVGDSDDERDEEAMLDAMISSGRVYQVDAEIAVGAAEPPPERIAAWERAHSSRFPILPRDTRYSEDLLRPGDTVTVAGAAETFDYGYPERTVIGGAGAAKISAGEGHHVTTHLTGAVWIGGAIGLLLIPLGLGLMLWTM